MPDKIKTTEERNNTVMLVDDEVSVLDIEADLLGGKQHHFPGLLQKSPVLAFYLFTIEI
jgi:hypothetical protein